MIVPIYELTSCVCKLGVLSEKQTCIWRTAFTILLQRKLKNKKEKIWDLHVLYRYQSIPLPFRILPKLELPSSSRTDVGFLTL